MSKFSSNNSKLIETLRETGIVSYACKKAGINRATFYRWLASVHSFKVAADRALVEGRENICDMAKSMLIKKAKEGSMDAIKYILSNNDPQYIPKRTVFVEPITSEDKRLIETLRARQTEKQKEDNEARMYERTKNPVLEKVIKKLSSEEQEFMLNLIEEEISKRSSGLF